MTPQALHDMALEQVRIEAQKDAWLFDDVNAACPYPFQSAAGKIYREAFLTAQSIQRALLAKTPQASSTP